MDRIVVQNVDPDLKKRFKVWAINRDSNMRLEIIRLIEKTLQDADKAKGK